jgi:hypothetical protein
MQSFPIVSVAVALLLLVLVSACGRASPEASPGGDSAPAATTVSEGSSESSDSGESASETTTAGEAAEQPFEDFDPNNFGQSTNIDNQWMPLKPGTRFVYEGTTVEDDGTAVPHRIEINVTDLTKEIGGVRSLATWDLDYSDGELVEAELAFYAQDMDGNVWRMGEYPEEYEEGELVAAPAWIHGFEDARAGIHMQADPQPDTPSYAQGWAPAVDWTDRGQVHLVGQETCVPVDCYEDVLVIAETSLAEPDAQQHKYYARGVGNVRVGWAGEGEQTKETLELVELAQLSAEALAEVRAKALELEQSAYQNSEEIYAHTPPLEQASDGGESEVEAPGASAPEVIVYASDLLESALSEFDFWDDPASPGGKLVGTPNSGGDLDPPPEEDPHVTFTVPVQSGVPYRCWIHMKVGAPKGVSQANKLWVQFSDAVDAANQEFLKPGTESYLTAQGPVQEGWTWVGCNWEDSASAEPLIRFRTSGEVTVYLQAGMEGVGFDQFLLSPAQFLEEPPAEMVVAK